tara:strand:- start:461 stop:625 length:165 start_codon:yes stop_codon:yes gene_type:complete
LFNQQIVQSHQVATKANKVTREKIKLLISRKEKPNKKNSNQKKDRNNEKSIISI